MCGWDRGAVHVRAVSVTAFCRQLLGQHNNRGYIFQAILDVDQWRPYIYLVVHKLGKL